MIKEIIFRTCINIENHFIRNNIFNVKCSTWKSSILLTEFLFGFIKTLLPARTLVRLREHDGYILDPGSVNGVHRCNMSHVATAIESWFKDLIFSTCGGNVIENDPLKTIKGFHGINFAKWSSFSLIHQVKFTIAINFLVSLTVHINRRKIKI